jgi:hypothetical protein
LAIRRQQMRSQTAEMFAPELAAMDDAAATRVLGVVDTLTQFEAPEHLRMVGDMSLDDIRSTLIMALTRLLTA